ncbi:FAD binding domain-containing protein [Stutzerimonas stutzeri]|uniref:FAD binding domain-containing protein n=1 Tax=Stutzerimonas stutzeri TaxID=316 RepID=UPI0015E3D8A2|nr:FAD binding domain-containing protein [Stutzerimonas stutzeri]MBA1265151.1 carbon monoxide dehydrogenase [Stutzerimonas stutzeri]
MQLQLREKIMRPSKFDYERADSLSSAVEMLSVSEGMAKPMAGGQSLVPMMNLRLARPNNLVSIRRLPELQDIQEAKKTIRIGAAVTHAVLEDQNSADVTGRYLSYVAKGIAYRAVRNRGTIGGSLCHADPAADWLTSLSAIGAVCNIQGAKGKRQVPVEELMIAPFVNALERNEILASIEVPKLSATARWAYVKFCQKTGEFAKSICAVVFDPSTGVSRAFLGGMDGPPLFLNETSNQLGSADPETMLKVAKKEIRSKLREVEADRLAIHLTMVERAIRRIEGYK